MSDCARLIPGSTQAIRVDRKKPVQSVRIHDPATVSRIRTMEPDRENPLGWLLPTLQQSRSAGGWLQSILTDFALVAVNWMLLSAALVAVSRLTGYFPVFIAGLPSSLLSLGLLHAALLTLIGCSEGLYASADGTAVQARILAKSALLATAFLSLAYGFRTPWPTALLIGSAGVLHFGVLWAWRRKMAHASRHSTRNDDRNVLIIGAGPMGRRLGSYLAAHPELRRRVCGFLDDERGIGAGVLGRVCDLARLARREFIDEIILVAPADRALTLEVLGQARRLRLDLQLVPEMFGCSPAARSVERMADMPVICLHAEKHPSMRLLAKRFVDLAVAACLLMVLSPLLAAIAALIKLDSPGRVFYVAKRAGRKGRLFHCYKFRTMVANADELKQALRSNNQRSGPFFKISDDPRVTRVGHFLRRFSLDELPQLWNVMKGDMSLVGPRPHPLDDVAAYDIEHLARLDVTPGITGLWQVTARRDPSFERGMELDREYIGTWNLRSDLRILLKTVFAVVQGSGE